MLKVNTMERDGFKVVLSRRGSLSESDTSVLGKIVLSLSGNVSAGTTHRCCMKNVKVTSVMYPVCVDND